MKKIFFIIVFLLSACISFSQTALDSLNTENPPDSISKTISNEIETSKQVKSDVDAVINYSAADSLIYDLKNKKVYLYNEAILTYKDLKLEAGRITVDQELLIMEAYGIPDSIRPGKFVQSPLMFQGNEKYEGSKLTYNFKNQQGSVSMGFSEAEAGYYFGDKIKKVTSDVLFIKNGIYTTSTDREDPEYYFLSPKMKVIPNDKVIAQSVFVYIEGVPVFWIPFGVFPNRTGRSSGLIPPKFGEDGTYGKYLSRLGYFWAMSNFTDFAFTTSYFSKGRIDLYGRFRYAKKYNYSGSVEGGYSRIRLGESTDFGTPKSDAWNLTLNHNQQLNPTSRFDAALTFTSGKNYYDISTNSLSELLLQNVISNVTYSKNWENTPFSLNANYYRDQNLNTGDLRERIPLLNFSITQTYPFESATSNYFNKKLYEYLSFSYSGSILNNHTKIKNLIRENPDSIVREFRSGIRHSLNFNLSPKFELISFSPFFNYSEIWYNKYVTKNFNPLDSSVITNDANAIKALRYFNTGVSFSTRFVGIFTPRIFNVRGIRHTITPAISYVYQPDFSDPKWGYYNFYTNEFGQQVRYSIFEKEVFGSAPAGESQSLAFTVGNVFEMKTYVNDTTENKFQLFNFDA
ncbi:MAG: putative LPS assembly protein LptD, partial [bacterium]